MASDELQLNTKYASKLAHQHFVASMQYQAAVQTEEMLTNAAMLLEQDRNVCGPWYALASGGFVKMQGDQVVAQLQRGLDEARQSKSTKLEQMTTSQRRLKAVPWSEEIGPDLSAAVLSMATYS